MDSRQNVQVLLVEDSPTDAKLLQFDLKQATGNTFEVTGVERVAEALEMLKERTFDVVLLDLTLPDSSGIDTFRRVHDAAPLLPVVVLTGLGDESVGVDAIRMGVQDYLVKGTVDGKTISRSIRYAIERRAAQEEVTRVNAELERRMAEIQKANGDLLESRRAALNLMEDALLARRLVEQSALDLRKSREDLNRAQAVAHSGSWRLDLWSNKLTWSDENYRIFGIDSGKELTYDTFISAVHPDDRHYVDTTWNAAIGGEPFDIEHRIVAAGEVKWVRNTANLEYDDNGVLRSGFGITQDITERKWMETELAEKSRQLEKLVRKQTQEITDTRESLDIETRERMRVEDELTLRQMALEAVYSMATAFDTSFTAMNDQVVMSIAKILHVPFAAIHHISESGLHTSSRYYKGELTHEATGAIDHCLLRAAGAAAPDGTLDGGKKRDHAECKACYPDEVIKSYVGVPILNGKGKAFGLICALDSVIRTFDEDNVRLIEIFARYLAHEQTQRELESQLFRSNELRVLGQLTSGVAHEVRNPLNGIMAIMSALSKELSEGESQAERFKPYLDHMQNQVVRLTDLMEDLLALGRPIREEKKGDGPIVETVGQALASWRQSLREKREVLFVKPEGGEDGLVVHADGAKIEQAIINLLQNAHQHTPEDKPIRLTVEPARSNMVRISVKDNGPGIPEEIMGRVFEPFFTTRKGGTGLGLSIVRHIVESHGGSLTVKNNEGSSGATFIIDLPLAIKE